MALDSQPGLSSVPGALHSLPFRSHDRDTQLRFNLGITTHPSNLAAQFSNPSPIIIEKISSFPHKSLENVASDDLLRNSCSSMSFSAVSEERLNLAVWLAKRDVKQKRLQEKLEGKKKSHPHSQCSARYRKGVIISNPEKAKARTFVKDRKPNRSINHEVTKSGAVVYVYTPDKNNSSVGVSESPPTHDPGPDHSPKTKGEQNEQEVKRLQKELLSHVRNIEELFKKECSRESLDPLEEARGKVRQQERAARSARMLYVIKQQVKEIQEDLEKLSPHKIKHTKKSQTMSRLAAVHRAAIRALQMFITQLNECGDQQIPSVYKELGYLIRQLSLCAAKLETGGDPAAFNITISILQQAEDLDLLLENKITSQAKNVSPKAAGGRPPQNRKNTGDTRSPVREGHGPPPVLKQKEPPEENQKRVNRRLVVDEPPQSLCAATQTEPGSAQETSLQERQAVLRSAMETIIHSGRLKGLPRTGAGQNRNKGVLIPQRPKGFRQPREMEPSLHAHFQKKTVAFKLKENRPFVREKRTPWVPPNPTSPPASPKRANWNREKRRLDGSPSTIFNESDSLKEKEIEREDHVTKEASRRLAWLDSEMEKRMHQLDDLYRKEISHLQDLRGEAHATKELVNDNFVKTKASRLQSNSHKHTSPEKQRDESLQDLDSFDQNVEIMPQEDRELEALIERMEEIEKYQESVRQRFHKIVYSDPDFWAQEEKERLHAVTDKKPTSPRPIRITKPTLKREPVVDILLEEPLEGDSLQINKKELSRSSSNIFIQRPTVQGKGLIPVSVPHQMLQSIQNYSERFDRHLRLTSHEEVGAFNPWRIAESLAEDLMNDALGEVAAELQDLCEGYAEAVFTSEFIEPTENRQFN
ncbi:protein moonraker [Pyxicephalus adspersus]|uniref:Protein moonraker n=1 Tax=Pyxicephalus adspersus TaxID=30357 RepID=A0AAV3B858_PYXAD|nr:TPA: hypothetical protein GDO54_001844 [Pyxicephalus adspersus]